MDRTRLYWTCQLAGWTAYLLINLLLVTLLVDTPGWRYMYSLALSGVGIGMTHAYRSVVRRWNWTALSLWKLAPRVLGASALIGLLITGFMFGLSWLLSSYRPDDQETAAGVYFLISTFNVGVVILIWSLIYFGVHAVWEHRRAEVNTWKLRAQVEATKLKALKLQLNPHFLFNSLNSVRALIVEDPSRAQVMVTRLARLLRTTLQAGNTATCPLREELQTVRVYLELEAVRLEERLQYSIEASADLNDEPVPFLLIQTLVENGIKHGVAQRPAGGTIAVAAQRTEDGLCLRVDNTGRLDPEALQEGVGLKNARERLQLLFGDDASLTLRALDDATVRAEVHLPRTETPAPRLAPASSTPLTMPSPA